jgi:hypothetical protein
MLRKGAEEAGGETLQEGFNQLGRISVDPSAGLFDPDALERYGESAVGGFALGGLVGGAAGGWRRSVPESEQYDLLNRQQTDTAVPRYSLTTQMDPLQQRIDRSLGIGPRTTPKNYEEIFEAAASEGSGQFVIDPTTGLERELSMQELYELRAGKPMVSDSPLNQGQETDITTPQMGLGNPDNVGTSASETGTPQVRTVRSEDDLLLRDKLNIVPNEHGRNLLAAIREAGLDPEMDELVPLWSAATKNSKTITKRSLDAALKNLDELVIDLRQKAAKPAQQLVASSSTLPGVVSPATPVAGTSSTQGVVNGAQAAQTQQAVPQEPQAPAANAVAAQPAATPAPAPVSDYAPTDVLIQRKQKRVVTPTQPATAYVAPETTAAAQAVQDTSDGYASDAEAWDDFKPDGGPDFDQLPDTLKKAWAFARRKRQMSFGLAKDIADEAAAPDDANDVDVVLEQVFGKRDAGWMRSAFVEGKTQEQIAQEAGVSRAAVDKVVGTGKAAAERRQKRIKAAAKKFGWEPDFTRNLIAKFAGTEVASVESEDASLEGNIGSFDETDSDGFDRGVGGAAGRDPSLAEAGFGITTGGQSQSNWRDSELLAVKNLDAPTREKIESLTAEREALQYDDSEEAQQRIDEIDAEISQLESGSVSPGEVAATFTQKAVDLAGEIEELQKLVEDALQRGQDTVAFSQGKASLDAVSARIAAKQQQLVEALTKAEEILKRGNTRKKLGAEPEAPETGKPKAEKQAKAEKPARGDNLGEKLWNSISEAAPSLNLKPYEELDAVQRGALDDIAKRNPNATLNDPSLQELVKAASRPDGKYGKDKRGIDRRPNNPYTAKELLAELKDFIRADIPQRKLRVVDSIADLLNDPDPEVRVMAAGMALENAYGVAANGRAYLIANRIEKGRGRAKFMHEVGVHLGLENLLPKAVYDRLIKQLKEWVESDADTDEVTLAARAMLRVERANTPAEDADAELLAYFIEEAVQAGIDPTADVKNSDPLREWFRTLWAAFKAAVRKLGFKPEALTAQDVVNLAFGAARLEIAGTWHGTDATFHNFRVGAEAADRQRVRFGKEAPRAASRSEVERTLSRLPVGARAPVRTIWSTLREYASRGLDKVVFTADLLDRAVKAGLKSASDYQRLMVERGVKAREHELRVEAIADMYQAIPSMEEGKRANDLARESTRLGKWAYQPSWLKPVKVDPVLNAEWNKLDPKAQAWVDAMFKFEHDMLDRKRKTVLDSTSSTYDAMIKAAQDAIDSGTLDDAELKAAKRDLAEAKRNKVNELRKFERLFEARAGMPYLPLKRFGSFAVVAKSAEYRAAEERGDAATLKKLEQDENHYYVDFAETLFEANTMRDQLEREFGTGNVESFEREQFENIYGSEGMLATMSKLRNIIEARPADDKTDRTAMRRMQSILSEMYLQALAENSARKSEMRRKGIAGDIDMLRSFTTQGKADAQFLSMVEYNDRIQESIQKMRREAAKSGAAQRMRASALFNEISKRYNHSLVYDPSPIAQKIARLTSVWFLATSPGYYLQNLTQPYMVSVPLMAGRHGWSKAAAAQYKAYTELGPVVRSGSATTGYDFTKVPADVRAAVDYLVRRGLVDIGLDTELGEFRVDGTNRVKAGWNKVDKFLRISTQKLEAINRLSTAIAAYRLELAKTGDQKAAMDYAAKVINDTHGDYTAFNAPRAFNTNFGKIALQFRKFQLIQLTLLAKLWRDAGLSTPEKRAATAALGFVLGHTAVMSGVMGLPGYAAIAWALGALFGDDEDPFDLTQWLRSKLGNEEIANLIMRGTPTLVGADMSGKIGMGNALSILPFTDVDLLDRRSSAEALGTLVGGASFGLFQRMADGIALIANGDYYKGIEQLMPKGITDVMKAVRYASDGVTRRNGDVTIPASEISEVEAVMQALGVPVSKITVRNEKQQYVFKTTQGLADAASRIKNDYARAARHRDLEAMREARQRWQRLQQSRKELGLKPQPISTLLKAPQEQAKRERNTINGVQFNSSNRGLVESL